MVGATKMTGLCECGHTEIWHRIWEPIGTCAVFGLPKAGLFCPCTQYVAAADESGLEAVWCFVHGVGWDDLGGSAPCLAWRGCSGSWLPVRVVSGTG